MKTSMVGLLVAGAALASTAFAATVKERVDTLKATGRPLVISVDKGMFTCSSCEPELKVKADGAPQKVPANAEYDQLNVSIKSPSKIEVVEELNGKNRAFFGYTVSPDGKTLEVTYSDYSTGKQIVGGYRATRVGPAPAGAHAVSGSWKIEQTSEKKPTSAAGAH